MLPVGGNFNQICYPVCPLQYPQPISFFNMYAPWKSQCHFLPAFHNFTMEIPGYFEGPSETKDTRKSSFQKMSSEEKESNCKNIQRYSENLVKNRKYAKNQQSSYFENPINNQESSYNNKRTKNSEKIKKTKRGPQNQNRNILPSIVQQIFSFISKHNKSKSVCERIFEVTSKPEGVEVSISRYYYYIKQVKQKQNHYVNERTLQILSKIQQIGINLFCQEEQQFYLRIARILSKHFLIHVSPFLTLHSKRIIQQKRIEHLNIRRVLLKMISQLDC